MWGYREEDQISRSLALFWEIFNEIQVDSTEIHLFTQGFLDTLILIMYSAWVSFADLFRQIALFRMHRTFHLVKINAFLEIMLSIL